MSRILELQDTDIEPPTTFGTVAGAGFLRGMAKEESRFVLILDVNQLVSAELIHLPSLIAEPVEEPRRARRSKRAKKREPAVAPSSDGGEPPPEAEREGPHESPGEAPPREEPPA